MNLQKEEGEMHEMKFREFLYKGTTFPARLVFDFLEPEFDRESYLTIEIGNEINQLVFNKI